MAGLKLHLLLRADESDGLERERRLHASKKRIRRAEVYAEV